MHSSASSAPSVCSAFQSFPAPCFLPPDRKSPRLRAGWLERKNSYLPGPDVLSLSLSLSAGFGDFFALLSSFDLSDFTAEALPLLFAVLPLDTSCLLAL